MLSAGLAVEPPHRGAHGLGPSLGAGLGAGLGAALGAGLGPPTHHSMLQAFTGGEFLRPLPPPRPGEPGPGAAMFSPPDLRYWLHHQQQQHLARYAASQSVGHHRLPPSPAPSPQPAPQVPAPAPSPSPVNLTAHKEDKERMAQHSLGYPYAHYPMAAPMFPPAPYSPYAARLPPPSDAPAAYSPPAGSPAPLAPPPGPPAPMAPKATVASRTFKVPVPAKDSPLKHRILAQPKHSVASSLATPLPPMPPMPAPVASSASLATTTALPQHPLASASVDFRPQDYQTSTGTGSAATTQPQFWKGSLIRLASGELRRVQEMKAEDFMASAERNPTLKADPATVVRITSQRNHRVSISLSVGGSESEIETSSEHPFFVYGYGWASCAPDRSLQLLGLSCRHLQVGDVVVSLTHRHQPQLQQHQHHQHHPQHPQQQQQQQRPQGRQASASARGGRASKKQQQLTTTLLPPPSRPAPTPTSTAPSPSSGDAAAAAASSKKRRWSAPDQLAAAAEEAGQAGAAPLPSKLARVPE